MSDNKEYVNITVTLPKEYAAFLRAYMTQNDMNRSQVVRLGLRRLMTETNLKKREVK